jgi:nucleotide-binding universal stress UspA family protein
MPIYERIVAGTDFSPTATIATNRAGYLSERLGAELTLVHAGTEEGPLTELAAEYDAKAIVRSGDPADVLITVAEDEDADLLVVGSVGMTGAKRFLLGSVPNKVSHHSSMDLLIVKTDSPDASKRSKDGYEKILVGTDGSPTATLAVERASELAAELGATPVIVCAHEPLTPQQQEQIRAVSGDTMAEWRSGGPSVPEEFKWRIADAAQAEDVLERAAEHASKHGVTPEVRSLEGAPADVLITLAQGEGFGLIIVGSVGMSGTKRFMLGNVPNRVSHHSPTDVLILHTA